jgi:enoyl-CoA hydratase/carnithine racemase
VNKVVPNQTDLLPTALKYAAEIIKNSPDSVRSTKLALLLAKEMGMAESYNRHAGTAIAKEVDEGENIKEGLAAFNEARMQARSILKSTAYIFVRPTEA